MHINLTTTRNFSIRDMRYFELIDEWFMSDFNFFLGERHDVDSYIEARIREPLRKIAKCHETENN